MLLLNNGKLLVLVESGGGRRCMNWMRCRCGSLVGVGGTGDVDIVDIVNAAPDCW